MPKQEPLEYVTIDPASLTPEQQEAFHKYLEKKRALKAAQGMTKEENDKIPYFEFSSSDADPSWRGNLTSAWQGEEWISFEYATGKTMRQLGWSKGLTQKTLRELCASGEVRSVRYRARSEWSPLPEGKDGGEFVGIEGLEEPRPVKRGEWKDNDLDVEGWDYVDWGEEEWTQIDVSEDDFEYWLGKQPKAKADGKSRKSPKRDLVREAIKSLWNGSIRKEIPNGLVEQQVGVWITSYCKRNNIPKPDISGATILRIAGRK